MALGQASAVSPALPRTERGGGLLGSVARTVRDGFLHIRVGGSPEEMGLQQGELLRHEIRDLIGQVHRHVLYGQPGVIGWGIRQAARSAAAIMNAHVPERYRQEMKGIARAADVSYGDIVLVNCFDDILANLRLLGAMFGRLGCSVLALGPERTAMKRLLCGRNLDYFVAGSVADDAWAATNYMKEHLVATEYAPRDRFSFIGVGWPGLVGSFTGLSESSVAVASLSVRTIVNRPLATPAPFLYRQILEEATSLNQAVAFLRRAPRTQANNVLVASGREGSAAVVEYTPWRIAVRGLQDGWLVATNHFSHPAMLGRNPRQRYESSWDRSARLGELCNQRGVDVGPEDIRDFMMDTHLRRPDATEYCRVFNPCTVLSSLLVPEEGRLWVRATDRPDRQFDELRLSASGPLSS